MKEHILLEKASRYTSSVVDPIPQDCTFKEKQGYWIKNSTGEIMMLSDDSCRPLTKKEDRETGEDQKGE
ncbi:hypothetical protein [Methanolacinia paynteri]|uniref:hypothetical protein n=1 Tax=Methanolacinia paynteri TaxID=230356 RepID=UPI00064E7047|nr:hypothetical protein [Methanolacinia paynteri]